MSRPIHHRLILSAMRDAPKPDFASLPRHARQKFLGGPTVLLVTSYSGTPAENLRQLSAAKNVVASDRCRQLREQCEATDRPFAIEVPVLALEAASPAIADFFRVHPISRVDFHLGGVLPGYIMEVLDWYCRALRAKSWTDFLPTDPSIEGPDRFYYLYIYLAMRKLGMDDFAKNLLPFIEQLVDRRGVVDEAWALEALLANADVEDPLLLHIAERYAVLMINQKMPL